MATANHSYSNQQLNMIQQQQQQEEQHQQHPTTDNDEATTNCSETMSTANEDEECFRPMQTSVNGGSLMLDGPKLSTSTSGACLSNEQALGPQMVAANNCRAPLLASDGDIQQSDNYNADAQLNDEQPLAEYLALSAQETDGGFSVRSELSLLASGATQAPPSYGTATRVCATLDVSQLRDALGPTQVLQQDSGDGAFRFTSSASQHYGLSLLGWQQQQQQQQPVAANQCSNASPAPMRPPLFNGTTAVATTAIGGHNPLLPMRTQQTQSFQLVQSGTIAAIPHLQSSEGRQQQQQQHLSSGGFLNRANCVAPHLNGGLGPASADELRAMGSVGSASGQLHRHQINLGPDNNQELSELNQLRLQQQVANLELAPINHVISARGSNQWQPRTNQCYLPGSLTTANAPMATNYSRIPVDQQQQVGQLDGRSSRKSARIMDALLAWPTAAAPAPAVSFKGDQQQQQQQASAANRNDSLNWHDPPSTSISGRGASFGTANVNVVLRQTQEPPDLREDAAHKLNLRPLASSPKQQHRPRQHNSNSNNNNNDSNNNPTRVGRALLRSKASPSGRSDENLERSSQRQPHLQQQQQQQQQQQANRKRRRHRSTSGRSVSPQHRQVRACNEDDCSLQAGERLSWPKSSSSPPPPSSSRGLSDGASTISANPKPGGNHNHKRTISAHCWLIDSSDDQTYGSSGRQQKQQAACTPSRRKSASEHLEETGPQQQCHPKDRRHNHHHHHHHKQEAIQAPQTHLTVAMMRQMIEQRQRLKDGAGDLTSNGCHRPEQYPSTKYLTQPAKLKPSVSGTSSTNTNADNNMDLTVSLRTNSLRMERILNRSPNSNKGSQRRALMAGQRDSRTLPAKCHQHHQRNRRCLSSSSSASSSTSLPGQCGGATSAANEKHSTQSNTAPRLSTLLSLLANLVRRGPGSSSVPRSNVAPSSGPQPEDDEYYHAAPASSISGSLLARSAGPSCVSGPYTAGGSLAISSSSSTSAYATESSHLSSANPNPLRLLAHLNTTPLDRPMAMTQLRGQPQHQHHHHHHHHHHHQQQQQQQHSQVPPSSSSTAGSSLFYSSSGNSGLQMSTGGSHSYEYCEDDRINETRFVKERGETINEEEQATHKMETSSPRSSRSQTSDEKNDDEDFMATKATGSRKGLRQATIMSDNELLSAGSEAGFQAAGASGALGFGYGSSGVGGGGGGATSLAAVVSQATPSLARRRWWWISLKDVLCRRPCSAGLDSAADSEQGALGGEPAQRYKSLRSRHRHAPSASSSAASTLENVLSLAKADRVFRARLLASLLVSCILLGLIGLLCGLIYSRSKSLYQRNRLGLLMDDSDYDLTWLWPHENGSPLAADQIQQSAGSPTSADSSRHRILELQLASTTGGGGSSSGSGGARSPTEQLMMDGSLRGPLIMIEQSQQLAQYQQTIAHMTNLQLANDKFIDLTQMASRLVPIENGNDDDNNNDDHDDETNSHQTLANSSSLPGPKKRPTRRPSAKQHLQPQLQLSNTDQELMSLTLLSNLHWPLVKWRHQNQQSMANFLSSFVVSSAGTVQPNLRSLLSVMLLADASPIELTTNNSQLIQFSRLNYLLKSSSYHIISCSNQSSNEMPSIPLLPSLLSSSRSPFAAPPSPPSLRRRFCEQLVSRYKRMMLILGQLNHSHLVKLRDPMDPAQTMINTVTSGLDGNKQQMQSASSSRTLLSFFLDRLALLDVQILAESTLAEANLEEFNYIGQQSGIGDLDDGEEGSSASSGALHAGGNSPDTRALSSILGIPPSPADPLMRAGAGNKWRPATGSLLDLAKLIIGDGPASLPNMDPEHGEWLSQLKRLETENSEAWRELLAKDLLYPWASHKLPRLIEPLNYDLFFHPNLTTKLVLGMVKIGFRLERPTRFIVLHCDKLNLVDVSLWLKQEARDRNRSSSGGNQAAGDTLQRIPIRRLLSNTKLEQIYIELQYPLNPSKTHNSPMAHHNNDLQFSHTRSTLNFGGELPLKEVTNIESLFILSISFNKTSLMQPPVRDLSTDENLVLEHGLEFVQYSDYFAQSEAELKTILYTQFEPQNAHRLFPSFDEPHFKAKFQLNLVHELGHQVLFNAPKRERVPYTADGAHQMSVFEATPIPLSTYLVAFVVCDAQNMKSITSRASQLRFANSAADGSAKSEPKHIQVQILAQFEQLGQAEFASQLVPQLLAFYQNHLNFPYPMDKLDLVAIPRAMPAAIQTMGRPLGLASEQQQQQQPQQQQQQQGLEQLSINQLRLNTMENMGLIWFKASILLVDTNLISQNLIEQVAMIISHQLAHQYFGNIVSISQWEDLWLYESLCQYLESMAMSQVQPDWRLEEQFVVTSIQDTLALEQFDWLQMPKNEQLISKSTAEPAQLTRAHQPALDGSSSSGQVEELEEAVDLIPEMGALLRESGDQWELGEEIGADDMGRTISASGLKMQDANELRRSSAILHMLLFNLLPTPEARARLLSRCLSVFRYGTMSRAQFWRQFGEQLTKEGSSERQLTFLLELNPAAPILSSAGTNLADGISDQLTFHTEKWLNFTTQTELLQSGANGDQATPSPSERVVFVRPVNAPGRLILAVGDDSTGGDAHRIHVRSASRLTQGLGSTLDAWLMQPGYPLITASFNRDRIQLRQERFSFAWSNEPGLLDDEPMVWPEALQTGDNRENGNNRSKRMASSMEQQEQPPDPMWLIPLMFVSRVNQKQARFFWMDKREMELPLQELSYSSVQDSHLGGFLSSPPNTELRKGHLNVWFKLNVNQTSLVRVNYDERNWEALTELLLKSHYSNHLLGPLDRANLIDDAITLMRCGKLSVGIAMNLTLYLEVGEREFMPWTGALRHLDQMQTLLNQNPLWHRYVLKLMQPISSVIGWKDDGPHLMRKLRRSLFSVALQYGDEKIINKAKQEFKGWLKNGRFIVPNLQELVYVAGVRYGDQQEWFHCWQKYQQLVALELGSSLQNQTEALAHDNGGINANGIRDDRQSSSPLLASVASPFGSMVEPNEPNAENEKRQLITALASTHNTWLLEQFLNYSLDSTKIQPHHLKHVMQTLGKNPVARLYLWRFVRLNWNSLINRYTGYNLAESPNLARYSSEDRMRGQRDAGNYQILETMIVESTKHFVTKLDYDEVKTFFETKRRQHKQRLDFTAWTLSLEQAIQKSLQVIKSNIHWRNYIEPKLTKWLSHYDSSIR